MFLQILQELMDSRGLNKSTFSKQANIPYTTIDGIFKKGYANIKLSTLKQIANFFNVSLDYLISGHEHNEQSFVTSTPENVYETICMYLRINKMSKIDFVKSAGIDLLTLSDWEKGKQPTREELNNVANTLGISLSLLLSGKILLDPSHYNQLISQLDRPLDKSDINMLNMYDQLDDNDKAEIRGEMKQMLKAEKYNDIQKELQNA